MKNLIRIRSVLTLCCLVGLAAAQGLPATEGKTLDDKTISISREVSGKRALLIVTFSRVAGEKAAEWTKALQEKGLLDGRVAFYQVAHLEDVPRFFRGMAISGIKRGIPKVQHATFVILTADLEAWKKFVSFEKEDDPYLLLVDARANITLRIQGARTDQRLKQLAEKIN